MRTHPLEVRSVPTKNQFAQSRWEVFSPHPLRIFACGPTNCGKSSAILKAVQANWHLYDTVVLFARTAHYDASFRPLLANIRKKLEAQDLDPDDAENGYCFDTIDELPAVIARQKQRIKEDKGDGRKHLRQMCVIIEDMLGSMRWNKSLAELFSMGRHYGTSCAVTSQIDRSRGASSNDPPPGCARAAAMRSARVVTTRPKRERARVRKSHSPRRCALK